MMMKKLNMIYFVWSVQNVRKNIKIMRIIKSMINAIKIEISFVKNADKALNINRFMKNIKKAVKS